MSTTQPTDEGTGRGSLRKVVARVATEALAPWVWVCAMPLAIAWHATRSLWPTLGWGFLIALTGSFIPMAIIIRGAKKGAWEGHHVTNREGRLVPFSACIASLLVGLAVLLLGGAPYELVAGMLSMIATLVISLAVTFGARWKISIHAAVAAGAVVTLVVVYGPWLWLLGLLAVLVCWSRVELRDHTAGQVLGGSLLGVLIGGFYFALLAVG